MAQGRQLFKELDLASGQFALLYDGDVCFGGGVIDQAF